MKPRRQPMQRSEIKRATGLKRTGRLKSSGPIKAKRRQSPEERAARELLKKRSGGLCEIQVPGVCLSQAAVWSHRKRRSRCSKTELWSLTNGLHGCGSGTTGCEGYLTEHGTDAGVRANGWTVHSTVDPARVPVWRWGRYVWLLPGGGVEPLSFEDIEKWVKAA